MQPEHQSGSAIITNTLFAIKIPPQKFGSTFKTIRSFGNKTNYAQITTISFHKPFPSPVRAAVRPNQSLPPFGNKTNYAQTTTISFHKPFPSPVRAHCCAPQPITPFTQIASISSSNRSIALPHDNQSIAQIGKRSLLKSANVKP